MERLKELRKKKGFTQQDVAEALNVERATYAQYELGKRSPNNDMLIKLAKFYGVTVDYILKNENSISDIREEYATNNQAKDDFIADIGEGVEIHFKNAKRKLTPEQIKIFKAFYKSFTEEDEEE